MAGHAPVRLGGVFRGGIFDGVTTVLLNDEGLKNVSLDQHCARFI
jgi:hypothetical protein